MRNFNIQHPHESMRAPLVEKINNLAKPKGSLGRLEELALQVGMIQQTLTPQLKNPNHILFSADHGIADEGVSFSPKEVTWQQTAHFFRGGTAIGFLCEQHGFRLNVVDSGVDFDFPAGLELIDMKVRKGTRNFLYEAAMTPEEMDLCIERGAQMVDRVHAQGCNVVSFGEMGIGNTSPSSLWMSYIGNIPLKECVGAGSGMVGKDLLHKLDVLERAAENYREKSQWRKKVEAGEVPADDPDYIRELIRWFGGYEMVMAIGGMLRAAELHMVVLVDGFIMTNCILAARMLYPQVLDYAVFGHCGDETGHRRVLDLMAAKPLVSLGLRLGEGTGAICAYPILVSAVNMINQMDTFQKASVTKYF